MQKKCYWIQMQHIFITFWFDSLVKCFTIEIPTSGYLRRLAFTACLMQQITLTGRVAWFMYTIQGRKAWKIDLIYPAFPRCVLLLFYLYRQTNTNWNEKGFFSSNFPPFYSFQCNNQRNIKAGSEYPTPTKFVLQRQNFFSLPFVIKPNIFYYQRQNELC